jgi:hypothetical protein
MNFPVNIVSPPDRTNKSVVLKQLTNEECQILLTDLEINQCLIKKHSLFNHRAIDKNVLRHGNSIFLYNFNRDGFLLDDNKDKFSNTLDLIFQFLPQYKVEQLGRAYWHILQPGERIDIHHDNVSWYLNNTHRSEIDRYHIFLNVPWNFLIIMDGELWNIYDDKRVSNSLIKFNLLDYHYYNNYSENAVSMLVIDFFRVPVIIKPGYIKPQP